MEQQIVKVNENKMKKKTEKLNLPCLYIENWTNNFVVFSSCLSHVWVKSPLVLNPPMDPISNVPNADPKVDFLCWESVFFYCTSDHLIFFFAFYFHQSSILILAKRLGLVPVNRLGWKPPKKWITLGFPIYLTCSIPRIVVSMLNLKNHKKVKKKQNNYLHNYIVW